MIYKPLPSHIPVPKSPDERRELKALQRALGSSTPPTSPPSEPTAQTSWFGVEDEALHYNNGYVQHHQHLYITFWGKSWNEHSGVKEKILDLYQWLNGSAYANALSQYFDHSGPVENSVNIAASWTDTREDPQNVTWAGFRSEVQWAIEHQGWGIPASSENQYIVIASPKSTMSNSLAGACGAHQWWGGGWSLAYTALFWPQSGCYASGMTEAWQPLQKTASHEWAETATDPIPVDPYAGWDNSHWVSCEGKCGEIWETIFPYCGEYNCLSNEEVADECLAAEEAGRWVNRLWDNYLEAANKTPCVAHDPAPERYSVSIQEPSPIREEYHSTQLRGSVDPAGWRASYQFEMQPLGSFPATLTLVGNSLGPVQLESEEMGPLKGNTTYTVRIKSESDLTKGVRSGVSPTWSAERQFTTPDWRPAVSTNPASGVIHQVATLNASVDSQGWPTTYHFEYGTQGPCDSKPCTSIPIPNASAGSGTTPAPFSSKLTGLEDGNYHYRIVAENVEGKSVGGDQTFVIDNRPLIKGTTATNVKSGSATLGGEIEPQNFTSTYHVEYVRDTEFKEDGFTRAAKLPVPDASAGTGFEYHAVSQETGVALEPETLYHYRLVASNVKGVRVGEEKTFKTQAVPLAKDFSWGKEGTGHGEFDEVTGLAVDSSGNVLVGDSGLIDRVQKFDSSGKYLSEFGKHGSGDGEFSGVAGLALTPGGEIWAADLFNNRLEKFSSSGQFLVKFGTEGSGNNELNHPAGVAIDPGNGNIWVADRQNSRIEEFNSAHAFIRTIKGGSGNGPALVGPTALALDKSGDVWVTDSAGGRATGYTPSGTFIAQLGGEGSGAGQLHEPAGIAVSPTGAIYVTDVPSGASESRMQAFSPSGEYLGLVATGIYQNLFNFGTALSGHTVYVGETGAGVDRVSKFHIPQAKATSAAAQSIKSKRATLAGTVEPNGSATTYRFEYGTTKAYGTRAPVPDKALGSETSTQEVQQSIGGLVPKTTYHYRLVAFNANGASYGEDKSFETTSISAPVASTEAASGIQPFHATLNATVNPNESETYYSFQYGKTTSYGKNIPTPYAQNIGEGYEAVKVSQTPSLEPHTTYHFRVNATNEGGSTPGADKTFTTPRAFNPPTYSSSFGSTGTGNGQFSGPWGDAVDSSGNLWVVDRGNNRIQKFNSKGEFICKIGSLGTGNGQFYSPNGIAADSSGNVWVVDNGNNRLQKIGSSCEYLSQFGAKGSGNGQLQNPSGAAIDPSGNIWVSDGANYRIEKFNSKGEYIAKCGSQGGAPGQFETQPEAIAADADGNVWVGDTDEEWGAQEFNSKCEYLTGFDEFSAGAPEWVGPQAMAIDPTGNIWIGSQSFTHIQGFYPEGEYVGSFGESSGPGQIGNATGLAAASDGTIWLVDRAYNRVEKWVPGTQYPVQTGRAALVSRTEATLKGSVNPEGTATSYQFEYGTTASFGSVIPAAPKSIGSGSSPVAVSQALSGLKANTTYYYHLVATSEKGTTYGETRHFKTLPGAGVGAVMRIGGKTFGELAISEASFALSGSFKMEFSSSGYVVTFNCTESGSGTLASGGVKKENVSLSCTLAGAPGCTVEPTSFSVDGSFHPEGSTLLKLLSKGSECWLPGEIMSVMSSSGSFEYGSEAVSMNVNSRATASMSGWKVTLTGNSKWSLSGTNTGKTLGFW
jgi:tripartite motif-containing protein 71